MSHTADVAELILAGELQEAWIVHATHVEAEFGCADLTGQDENLLDVDGWLLLDAVSERHR